MPNFDAASRPHGAKRQRKAWLPVFTALLLWLVFMAWFFQNSLEKYWQYAWQQDYPLKPLQNFAAWQAGGDWARQTEALHAHITRSAHRTGEQAATRLATPLATHFSGRPWAQTPPAPANAPISAPIPAATPSPTPAANPAPPPAAQASHADAAAMPATLPPAAPASTPAPMPAPAASGKITLKPGQKVFFVGDSLMQGVAPHMQQALLKRWRVASINASRHSTGLAYPDFFNWPQTVRQTFAQNPGGIGAMVVLLGANDLRAMNNPQGGATLALASPAWQDTYRARVREMAQTAQSHGARVLWLQLPNMRSAKMNGGAQVVNALFEPETTQAGGIFLPVNALLGMPGSAYAEHAPDPKTGIPTKVRSGDGVHLSAAGYKLVAEAALAQFDIAAPSAEPAAAAAVPPSAPPVAPVAPH